MKKLPFKLPSYMETIVYDYLAPMSQGTPLDLLTLVALTECSKMLCFKRIKIEREETSVFPNIYAMVFAAPGVGKDRTLGLMKKASADTTAIMQQELLDYIKIKDAQLRLDVNSPEMNKMDGEGKPLIADQDKKKYIKENQAREVAFNIGSATREGLLSQRAQLQEMGYGICHFSNTEFANSIKSTNSSVTELIGDILNAYEDGENNTKAIKGETKVYNITSVPQTFFAHSAIKSLTKDYQANEVLQNFFNDGFARRALVSYTFQSEEPTRISRDDKRRALNLIPTINEKFKAVWNSTTRNQRVGISNEVYSYFEDYQEALAMEAYLDERSGEDSEAILSEKKGRHRKALRVAGIYTLMRGGTEVSMDDYIQAQALVEYYSERFVEFYKRRPLTDGEVLISAIEKTEDKYLTMSEVDELEIIRGASGNKSYRKKSAFEEAEEKLKEQDKVISEEKMGRFKIWAIRERHKTITPQTPAVARISYSKNKDIATPVKGYEYTETPFEYLHKYMAKPDTYTAYSNNSYKDGYKDGEHALMTGNIIFIDIDNDDINNELTIEKALAMVKDFKALIIPTKSHQKAKGNHPAMDRFRIAILADSPINPTKAEYKDLMTDIMEELGFLNQADPSVVGDKARFFFPSPEGSQPIYTNGTKMFSWLQFDKKKKMEKPNTQQRTPDTNYDRTDIDTIKATVDYQLLAQRLGKTMRFTKSSNGHDFYSCPFHNSQSGTSFWITKEPSNLWHCTKCGGGDALNFIQEARDCTFLEAKEFLINL